MSSARTLDERLTDEVVADQLGALIGSGLLSDEDTAVLAYDLDELGGRCRRLVSAFPDGALHTAAVKAVAFPAILEAVGTLGFGAEAASDGEIALARAAGIANDAIIFDSPCKTDREIRSALELGVLINADNLDEVERLAAIVGSTSNGGPIGLRVNPQVGTGSIESTSVAGSVSKFGSPVDEQHRDILDAYRRHRWLTMIHSHVGSQGTTLRLLVDGVRRTLDLAAEIGDQVSHVDIGGGLPVSYQRGARPTVTLDEYVDALGNECPEVFDGRYRILTEFGRWLFAGAGWIAARVENVKQSGGRSIAVVHVGADLFVRPAYRPDQWSHEITVHRPDGVQRTGAMSNWTIAGPLCFAGDVIATDRPLPSPQRGDWIVIHDAGAYTASMVSRYNSRSLPAVATVRGDDVRIVRRRERPEALVAFWSSPAIRG